MAHRSCPALGPRGAPPDEDAAHTAHEQLVKPVIPHTSPANGPHCSPHHTHDPRRARSCAPARSCGPSGPRTGKRCHLTASKACVYRKLSRQEEIFGEPRRAVRSAPVREFPTDRRAKTRNLDRTPGKPRYFRYFHAAFRTNREKPMLLELNIAPPSPPPVIRVRVPPKKATAPIATSRRATAERLSRRTRASPR